MNALQEARERLDEFKKNINKIIKVTFEEEKKHIIKLNADVQMYDRGEKADGSIIRPAYNPVTVSIKRRKGQPTDRVTLRDKGRLHRTLIVTPKDDYVEITSDVEYAKFLFKKYGDDILGIQQKLLKDFVELYVVPKLTINMKYELLNRQMNG